MNVFLVPQGSIQIRELLTEVKISRSQNEAGESAMPEISEIPETDSELFFADLTKLAANICGTPSAFVCLNGGDQLLTKKISRETAFCARHLPLSETVLIVEDTLEDERFLAHPGVADAPFIRFYAGVPLVSPENFAPHGALCVIDYVPRTLSGEQIGNLELLARQVVAQLELRKTLHKNVALADLCERVMMQASDGIHQFDFDGRIKFVNEKFCEITGRTASELIGMNVEELILKEHLLHQPTNFEKLRSGGTRLSERPFVRPDGSLVTVEISSKILDSQTIQAIVRDISERKKIERELLESELRFRDFVNSSLVFFCTHDLDGKVASVSPAAAAALGYAESELVGENLSKILLPAAHNILPKYLKQLAVSGESHGFMRILTKSGERRIWSYNNIVRTDANGELYVLGSSQDVTELKRSEEELKKSRSLFHSFINNSPAAIFLKNERGNYVMVNRSFEELFNVRFEDLEGKDDFDIFPAEIAEKLRANDLTVLRNEQLLKAVEFVPTPDGTPHFWLSHKFCFKNEDGKKFVGGIAVNITERKRIEDELKTAHDAALESSRLKSNFLTNVSHEIRTPMNGVIGMTELLLETPLDRSQREYAETIRQSGESLLTVINDILDLAKIEAGKLRFESVEFDVRETVESTVEMFAERAFRKNLEIGSFVEADVPQILGGDPGRLRQILTNLLSNAVKFTEKGEICLNVRLEKDSKHNILLRFTVTDTGVGISGKNLEKVFQPFVQADNSTTREFGGTGLGLAICKQLVEIMNGEISVESRREQGTIFSFTATFAKLTDAKPRDISSDSPNVIALLENKKILIADEKRLIRQSLKEYAAMWNISAVEAASGEQALKLLSDAMREGKPFDIALIDLNLPDWEGFSLARRIKSDENLEPMRIILTTAYGQRGDAAKAHEIGVAAYLTKPVRGSQFLDCLVTVLQQKCAEKDNQSFVTRHSLREAKSRTDETGKIENTDTLSILVVEDNEVNRRLVLRQLEQIGLTADVAFDGVDALEKIETKNYGLILMDCQMPRLDGYETTREIRRRENFKTESETSFRPSKIIALTAHTFLGEREKCLAAGMNDYLPKPLRVKDLRQMIEYWVQDANESEVENETHSTLETGDTDFSDEIQKLFISETARHSDELKTELSNENPARSARLAHSIRGNALAVGAQTLAAKAADIETAIKNGDSLKAVECFEIFHLEFLKLQTESTK